MAKSTKRGKVARKKNVVGSKKLALGEIVKNAPIPGISRGPHISFPEQFAKVDSMEVNDSITFPSTKEYLLMVDSIRKYIQKISGKTFLLRKVSDDTQGLWRVESKKRRWGNRFTTSAKKAKNKKQ